MRSITTRLILAFLLVGLSGSVLIAFFVWHSTRSAFDQFILRREQLVLINSLLLHYQTYGSWQGVDQVIEALENEPLLSPEDNPNERRNNAGLVLVDADQTVVYSTFPAMVGRKVTKLRLRNAISLSINNRPVGWLIVTDVTRTPLPDSPEGRFLANVKNASLISMLIAVMLALLLGSVLAYTMTSSLRELTDATQDIARGQYGRQVAVRSKDELGRLAASFNQMSQQLAHAIQARKQMTADIAHDLRSPLTVIQGYTEALSDGKLEGGEEIYTILHQETQYLSRLVDDLRLLSLADAGELPLQLQTVDPALIAERTYTRHALNAQQKGVTFDLDIEQHLPPIRVDTERMAQVLDNLMTNSLRYTPAGGKITLRLRREQNRLLMQVEDTGSGIAPEDLPRVFNRFYRADSARQSNGESGLGLAIAKSLVEAQGGSIAVASEVGKGTTFTITFNLP